MNYRAAHAAVAAFADSWRKKSFPFEKVETVKCPACAGNLHLVQTSFQNAANTISAQCDTAFCVHYTA